MIPIASGLLKRASRLSCQCSLPIRDSEVLFVTARTDQRIPASDVTNVAGIRLWTMDRGLELRASTKLRIRSDQPYWQRTARRRLHHAEVQVLSLRPTTLEVADPHAVPRYQIVQMSPHVTTALCSPPGRTESRRKCCMLGIGFDSAYP